MIAEYARSVGKFMSPANYQLFQGVVTNQWDFEQKD